ncbi:group II truncated hemoglobin [Aestuariicella hydrocarbonica]|uniref:Group II truncated hemoglobin n=1 Tax=Pseudomaricurvus hydrocarbonicus TaxID=1470433 RepID=A0A9E5JS14_9GAMM|nr:group II truncated hemoglobin [Aestuariicella hydrocarbonica]NHO64336.1 group II truncated hemoglobin [Aestuariicella hydrocarbonica]
MSAGNTPYQLLGADGIRQLAHAFYDAMDELPEAERIRHMHGKNLDSIKDKLTDYLTGWMGGPPVYHEKHGTVCLTEPHAAYAIGPEERDQWVLCFDKALDKVEVSEEVKQMLHGPIRQIARAVQNREESIKENTDPNVIAVG